MTEVCYAWLPHLHEIKQYYMPAGMQYNGRTVRILEYRLGDPEILMLLEVPGFLSKAHGTGRFSFIETYEPIPEGQEADILDALKERYPQIEASGVPVDFL